ncbi:metallophosphoesterase family protein [Cyanobacterium sp. Dongsha4]|uniref:metallophosphoesterase family protein n=1 Tax=Cyanobacterium sp. DS4 TaxID=2878255 RepID=UPI002E812AC1|nr:metallophosphoesterase family protein [Cyanobacterium sp. Dongsha4]WVL01479.1 serine/threonine protein phosphatase [Cyanobacterium sp. Dongsha4]
MSHKRLVIGDVHGHYEALCSLFNHIAPTQEDQVYFLGDLIDRGPESSQVVEFVMKNDYHCILGNHEIMLLDALGNGKLNHQAFQSWLQNGGNATVMSYGHKMPSPEHLDWMKSLPFFFDLGDYWLVHAGVDPRLNITQQSPDQFCWIRSEFHSTEKAYFKDKTIIIGHTITFTFNGLKPGQIAKGEGWLGIDTGVYHHGQGWLSALDLNTDTVYQVDSFGKNFRSLPLSEVTHNVNTRKLFARRQKALF